jgi:predicted regulator of Ras-like GTPase activity (Roadblock/LC7/MglB family)
MFEKQTIVDRIEVLADQTVAVRYVIIVTEDGLPFAEQIKGNYFKPGDDYSAEDAKVQAICATVHTAKVIAAYQTAQINPQL